MWAPSEESSNEAFVIMFVSVSIVKETLTPYLLPQLEYWYVPVATFASASHVPSLIASASTDVLDEEDEEDEDVEEDVVLPVELTLLLVSPQDAKVETDKAPVKSNKLNKLFFIKLNKPPFTKI